MRFLSFSLFAIKFRDLERIANVRVNLFFEDIFSKRSHFFVSSLEFGWLSIDDNLHLLSYRLDSYKMKNSLSELI